VKAVYSSTDKKMKKVAKSKIDTCVCFLLLLISAGVFRQGNWWTHEGKEVVAASLSILRKLRYVTSGESVALETRLQLVPLPAVITLGGLAKIRDKSYYPDF